MATYKCDHLRCPGGGVETESKEELDRHLDQEHPVRCMHHSGYAEGKPKAAYAYNPGAPGSYTYCADCAERAWERNETFRRKVHLITRSANEDADRLPQDHPVEQAVARGAA